MKKDDVLNYLIIPIDESLKLYREDLTGSEELIGYLQVGRSLNLRSLLLDSPVNYNAKADGPTTVLKIPREIFIDHIRKTEGMFNYLFLMTSNSAIRTFKKKLDDLDVPFSKLLLFFNLFEKKIVKIPKRRKYRPGKALHFCASGEYRAIKDNLEVNLSEASWWGGAFLTDKNVDFTVLTAKDTYFHIIELDKIRKVLDRNILDYISSEPFLREVEPNRQKTKISSQAIAKKVTEVEFEYIESIIDTSLLVKTEYIEDYFETFAKNLCYLWDVEFDFTSFDNLNLKSSLSVGDLAQVFYSLGYTVYQEKFNNQNKFITFYKNKILIYLASKANKYLFYDVEGNYISLHENDIENVLIINEPMWSTPMKKLELSDLKRKVAYYLNDQDIYLWTVIGLVLLVTLVDQFIPMVTGYVIDDILPSKDFESLWVGVGGMFLMSFFNLIFNSLITLVTSVYSGKVENLFVYSVYNKVLNLSLTKIQKLKIGGILNRVSEVDKLRDFLVESVYLFLESIVGIIIACGFLFYYSGKVALISLALLPLFFGVRFFFIQPLKKLYKEIFEDSSDQQSLMTEVISSIGTIKANAAEKTILRKWESQVADLIRKSERSEHINAKVSLLLRTFSAIVRVVCIYICADMALEGKMSPGVIVSISMYLGLITNHISQLVGLLSEYEELKVSLDKINDITGAEAEESLFFERKSHRIHFEGKIQFDRVSFRYKENLPWILSDLSLSIYPRQKIAIVGESGCGKTTLAKLIVGLDRPNMGRILFDGYDSSFTSLKMLRDQVGYLPQHNHLFAGSIKENIAITTDSIDQQRLTRSSEMSYSKNFIFKFPTNFDQYLAEGGVGLSGGERQRLALARLIYQDPNIIVMDESTSALDADSEHAVMETIHKGFVNKTVIIIAHRLSTVKNADNILVMEGGKVVEEGKHDDLVRKKGVYFHLFSDQIALGESL